MKLTTNNLENARNFAFQDISLVKVSDRNSFQTNQSYIPRLSGNCFWIISSHSEHWSDINHIKSDWFRMAPNILETDYGMASDSTDSHGIFSWYCCQGVNKKRLNVCRHQPRSKKSHVRVVKIFLRHFNVA